MNTMIRVSLRCFVLNFSMQMKIDVMVCYKWLRAISYRILKTELTSKVLLKLIQITSVQHEVMFMFIERRITYANAHIMLALYFLLEFGIFQFT